MKDVQGKVAVVTGAASGIGRGLAEVFAEAGMKVVLSDVERARLDETNEAMRAKGHDVFAVTADVASAESVEALARSAEEKYGAIHVLCNNAGVAGGGALVWETSLDDWAWTLGVNLMGVVHGIAAFVPRMIAHGQEGHVVNTASMAGLLTGAGSAPYAASKSAVVSISEALYQQLRFRGTRLSVSVLCPAWVDTAIADSDRNRPAHFGETPKADAENEVVLEWIRKQLSAGLAPREVARQVLDALKSDRFYILTHPEWTPLFEQRVNAIVRGENPPLMMPPRGEELFAELMRAKKDR